MNIYSIYSSIAWAIVPLYPSMRVFPYHSRDACSPISGGEVGKGGNVRLGFNILKSKNPQEKCSACAIPHVLDNNA